MHLNSKNLLQMKLPEVQIDENPRAHASKFKEILDELTKNDVFISIAFEILNHAEVNVVDHEKATRVNAEMQIDENPRAHMHLNSKRF